MKTKRIFLFLTVLMALACTATWAQPLSNTQPTQSVAMKEEPRQVNSLEELFDLVSEMKENATLEQNQDWVLQEYNRLVRAVDEQYHPTQNPKAAKDTTEVRPAAYSWAVRDGRP